MFSSEISVIAVIVMTTLCVGGLAWVFLYPYLSGEARAEKRMKSVRNQFAMPAARRNEQADAQKRRKAIQDTLTDLEAKRKRHDKPSLRVRLQQAGLTWTVQTYFIISGILAVGSVAIAFLAGMPVLGLLAIAVAMGVGFPHWLVGFLRRRRAKKFLEEFANAVDVIVRGVKAGLPLNDCLRMVAAESAEPVKSEFRHIIESQALGLPVAECVERMYERMPLPEVNFLSIVIAIQQKSGGNLSEALGNLSKVLRDRKRMKGKIQAMSQEAKSSAAIIAALPFCVMMLVFLTTPQYIALLWQEQIGHVMLVASGVWMLCGILVMRKMINFDF